MANLEVVTLHKFVSEISGDFNGITSNSRPGTQLRNKKSDNNCYSPNHRRKREHIITQLKKQFGGDIRARLKAKLAANSS
jgi:hypothetical protein